jgi:hypothetical protein
MDHLSLIAIHFSPKLGEYISKRNCIKAVNEKEKIYSADTALIASTLM